MMLASYSSSSRWRKTSIWSVPRKPSRQPCPRAVEDSRCTVTLRSVSVNYTWDLVWVCWLRIESKIIHSIDRLFKFLKVIIIDRKDTGIHLKKNEHGTQRKEMVITMALEGLNPAIGSTGEPSRWRVSPMWADDNQVNQKTVVRINIHWIPSDDCFMLHAIYPTWPGWSTWTGVSSGCIIPTSVISYFFRVWHETILSPKPSSILVPGNLEHSSLTSFQSTVLYIDQRDHSSIFVIPRYLWTGKQTWEDTHLQRIKHKSFQRFFHWSNRWRDSFNDGV